MQVCDHRGSCVPWRALASAARPDNRRYCFGAKPYVDGSYDLARDGNRTTPFERTDSSPS